MLFLVTMVWCIQTIYTPDLLAKFGPKSQDCQFKLKFGTYGNSYMQYSVVLFTFSVFTLEMPVLKEFGLKTQNNQFKLKFDTKSN